jgi:hypothetical protein
MTVPQWMSWISHVRLLMMVSKTSLGSPYGMEMEFIVCLEGSPGPGSFGGPSAQNLRLTRRVGL